LTRYLIRRTLWALWSFFVATLIVYVIFFVISTDPYAPYAHSSAGLGAFGKHIVSELHLDVPVYQQYWIFVWNMIRHASLGYSFQNGQPVRQIVWQDGRVTGSLIFGGVIFWLLISIPIGILSALRPRSFFDRFAMVFVLVGIASPPVWLGLILAYVFGFKLGWFPISDYCSFFPSSVGGCSGPAEWAYHMVLPWAAFTWLFAAIYVRMIRASLLDTAGEDYVRTARAKGAPERRVVVKHILRNSMLPVVTMLGMDMAIAFSGAVFIEQVFNLPGLGGDLLSSIQSSNIPVIVGVIVFVCLAVVVLNFVVDVLYVWLDPRIRL
jgi:peptide/nickel transport system permease protein